MAKLKWAVLVAIGVFLVFYVFADCALKMKVVETYFVSNRGRYYFHKLRHPVLLLGSYLYPLKTLEGENIEIHTDVAHKGKGKRKSIKEAAEESLDMTKSAVEDSAKSAAEMTSEAVHKTAGFVKKTISHGKSTDESHDEL